MKILPVVFAALLGAASAIAEDARGDAPACSFEGRVAYTSDGTARLGFPGVVLRLRFTGTEATLRTRTTSEELYLDVSVDGASPVFATVPKGESDFPLARQLSAGEHTVTVWKRIEASVGVLEIVSAHTDGRWLPPAALPARRLLFLGDSFTAGQATTVEDGGPMDPSKARRQNARLAYPRLLAERVQAQCHLLAYAGRGVIRDWQGVRNVRLGPDYYENTLPDDDNARWDPARYVPDVIGVCLGNNDFDPGIPDQTEYVQRYGEFIRKLRRDAPAATIVLITSPSLTDGPGKAPKRSVQKAYLDEVAARLGDPKIQVVQLKHYDGVPGDWHPSGTAHRAVADELEPIVRRALGLSP